MKNLLFIMLLFAALFYLVSCDDDNDLTIDNKDVTETFDYVQKSFVPLTFDSTGMPLTAQISFDGTGSLSDIGPCTLYSTFKFNFAAGMGTDFQSVYTGANSADNFKSKGSSQVQPDGSIIVTETLYDGKGKFARINGGGPLQFG